MWTEADLTVEIDEADEDVMLVAITTPVGKLRIIGNITRIGRVLHVRKAHADGLHPGALGRAGLNAVGRKLLVEADVDEIIIEGGTRTTGKNAGRPPKPFRFPGH
jgi:hypothetical protein